MFITNVFGNVKRTFYLVNKSLFGERITPICPLASIFNKNMPCIPVVDSKKINLLQLG